MKIRIFSALLSSSFVKKLQIDFTEGTALPQLKADIDIMKQEFLNLS